MTTIEALGLWIAVFAYVLAVLALTATSFFDKRWLRLLGSGSVALGFGAHSVAIEIGRAHV